MKKIIVAVIGTDIGLLLFALLLVLVAFTSSCVSVPKGQYTLHSKNEIQTFNPSSPRATLLTFKNNETGRMIRKRVFIDTFSLGECYYFVKHKP